MNTSIQQFYKPDSSAAKPPVTLTPPGDGFTPSEVAAVLEPTSVSFDSTDYTEISIGDLPTGLGKVCFSGRVVNWRDVFGKGKREASARGWHSMLLRGDGGVVSVKLYFSQQPYALYLGQLITIYTNHIATASTPPHNVKLPHVLTACSIFPGRDASCHLILHAEDEFQSAYRTPLNHSPNQPLAGLINLKAFSAGGNEIPDAKILVCVKSMSGRKDIKLKKGGRTQMCEVGVFDDTAECVLKLWGSVGASARRWEAGKTILLIASPAEKVEFRGVVSIGLAYGSMVDVEPEFVDATWLRKWVEKTRKRDGLKQEFPEGVFDFDAAMYGVNRILFRIEDVDLWARSNPGQRFTGFLNLVLADVSLVLLQMRNMLMVTECCGIPIYTNTPTSRCKHCSASLTLKLNPKVIGNLGDETGSIASGRLLWSDRAWKDLWGRSVDELVCMPSGNLRLLEQRMVWLRYSFCFGWDEDVGKIAILAVRS